jgi:hypothetical protein
MERQDREGQEIKMVEIIKIDFNTKKVKSVEIREGGVVRFVKVDKEIGKNEAEVTDVVEDAGREGDDVGPQELEARAWKMHEGLISVRLGKMRPGENSIRLYTVPYNNGNKGQVQEALSRRKAMLEEQHPDYAFKIGEMPTPDLCLTARRVGWEVSAQGNQNYKNQNHGREDLQEHSA